MGANAASASTPTPDPARRLVYAAPAANVNEALPIGNGRLGAMVYGQVAHERISLNDDRLWAGLERPAPRTEGPELLAQARRLFVAGDRREAQELLEHGFLTDFNQPYLPAGSVLLDWERPATYDGYERDLDLGRAIAGVRIVDGTRTISAEHFVTVDEQVVVARYAASTGQLPSVRLRLAAELRHTATVVDGDLLMIGRVPAHVRWIGVDDLATPDNMVRYDEERSPSYAVRLRVGETDGTVVAQGDALLIEGATVLTLFVATATDHRGADHAEIARTDLDRAVAAAFEDLRARHVAAHGALFDRVRLTLPTTHAVPPTTDARLQANAEILDPDLLALQFDVGRYLLIASSRPGSLPANLQGIWNESVTPPWWDNFTININLQMNYWPVYAVDLAECADPLRDFVIALSRHGEDAARIQYGARGWVAHHQVDAHLQATPVGYLPQGPIPNCAQWALWPFGGAWLALDLLDRYAYTGRLEDLDAVFPVALGAAQFLIDWLVDDPVDPRALATYPSTSPENTYLYRGDRIAVAKSSTMDIAITRALFTACLGAAVALQDSTRVLSSLERDLLTQIIEALPRLPEPLLSDDGRLLEYDADWPEGEHPHRHISQVFELCPGNRISVAGTPDLAAAASAALDARGDSGTGWSLAWKARARARLGQGAHALSLVRRLFDPVDSSVLHWANDGGGTYPNLLMACPPFMIEANFGYVSALLELFVQDHTGVIDVLPACPPELGTGRLEGVRLRGGLTLTMQWDHGRLTAFRVVADRPQSRVVSYGGREVEVELPAGGSDLLGTLVTP